MATDNTASTGKREEVPDNATGEAVRAHVVPFGAWLLLMFLLPKLGVSEALGYALRTTVCVGLFFWMRPWRWYAGPQHLRHLLASALMGIAVWAIWVLPETSWLSRLPSLQHFYLKYLMLPLKKPPAPVGISPYAPATCGWLLTAIRLFGSAFVIAVIEEFFWRGFLYRWLQQQEFVTLNLGTFNAKVFLLVSLFFGLEHERWFVGIIAGLAYGWLAVKTRNLWAASLAHVITNLVLGIHVLVTGQYGFW